MILKGHAFWRREYRGPGGGSELAIITNAGGCGAMLASYVTYLATTRNMRKGRTTSVLA